MFDLQAFYAAAQSGGRPGAEGLLAHLRSFEQVIIWGAGALGESLGVLLQGQGIPVRYWDLRARELGMVNGLPVGVPFSGDSDPARTAVLLGIGNRVVWRQVCNDLASRGFMDVIQGFPVFQALICPFDCESGLSPDFCSRAETCVAQWCERLYGVAHAQAARVKASMPGEPLRFNILQFVINQRCTLSCKYCNSYLNRYPAASRVDHPVARVMADMDRVMDAVDSVAVIGIQGGEPFMHRDFGQICRHLLTKKNFGMAYVATSGTAVIQPEQLEGLQDPRFFISLSNYSSSISEKHQRIYDRNLEVLERSGVLYRGYRVASQWAIPSKLYDKGQSVEEMTTKKQGCWFPDCLQVKNGRMHPCDFGAAVHGLGVADYPDSYVDLTAEQSLTELRESILAWRDRPYYAVCSHCESPLGYVDTVAEQGYMDFMEHPDAP